MQVIFINSHPIQYFAPLYRVMSKSIDTKVLYCSDETIKGKIDKEFGVEAKWDIPLLTGYRFCFLKNYSPSPSIFNGFWGLINFSIISKLKNEPPSIIIIHGWGYFTHVLTILLAKCYGHKVCLRAETPLNQELIKNPIKKFFKYIYLKLLFLPIHYFLYIGKQNKAFYAYYGIKESKLISVPYSVDNEFFSESSEIMDFTFLRKKMGLNTQTKVILFVGKYIPKKRPLDLLKAFTILCEKFDDIKLIMVGEGILRVEMEDYIIQHNLQDKVVLTGFINQSEITHFYKIAYTYVMCSGLGETWGLSVNEAMNFGIPVLVSETCGCSSDLVCEGINGYTFNEGDINDISNKIEKILLLDKINYEVMGKKSKNIIQKYSFENIIEGIKQIA